jgi:DNA-binding MarR family transcriptional regulator
VTTGDRSLNSFRSLASAADDYAALADVIAGLRRAMRRAARAIDPTNSLSVAQLELLSCLAEHPGARPGEIARLLHLAPNSVTTLLTGLRAFGMIDRSDDTSDRRAISLSLTETGALAVRAWQRTNTAILRAAVADLDPGWRHLLSAAIPALSELVQAIEASASMELPRERTPGHRGDDSAC